MVMKLSHQNLSFSGNKNNFMKSTKRISIWIIFIFSILNFISCEEKPEIVYTISGYLYDDCNMVPISNQELELRQNVDNGGLIPKDGYQATAITDSNGYFYFEFENVESGYEYIRYIAGAGYNTLIEGIPQQMNIENLNVYKNPTCFISVSLNVINAHSATDVLIVNNLNNFYEDIIINGPFESGLVYESINYPLFEMCYDSLCNLKGIDFLDIGFHINEEEWTIERFSISACDTIFVQLDIY